MKKVLLDTSVLVAATLAEHEHHEVALPWLSRAHRDDFELLVAGHSVAEMFSVLTRYPLRPRLSPTGAARIIRESVKSKARIVALTPTEYLSTVQQVADLELRGGIVYDALIARAAEKGGADQLVTLNLRHFKRAWPPIADRLVDPR
ncbi:hypothetical protein ABI59_15070 [Acidobacteria bacterium Mor1]|nr:hypothetical protein ABI59_15070 [Acidobacteria bacterium Mor1]